MKAICYNTELKSKPLKLGLFSDLHCDSPDFDNATFTVHASACLKEGRYILLGGDVFDAILPRDAKRFSPSRNQNNRDDQINYKLEQAYNLLSPYKDIILFVGRGNHEQSVLKFHSVDLIDILVKELGNPITQAGNYQNWLRFNWVDKKGVTQTHYDILQHHGAGGAAPVTKGMIDFNRLLHGTTADLVWIGHKHNGLISTSDPYMYCKPNGKVEIKNRQAIMTPSYQKGRSLDYNVNFAEQLYTYQSMPGYGALDLKYKDGKIISKLQIIHNPEIVIGALKEVNIKHR